MSTALMIRDDANLAVTIPDDARERKAHAMGVSLFVNRVTNADEQAKAVEAQQLLKTLASDVEKSRKEIKKPIIEFGRMIDDTAKEFTESLKAELNRTGKLVGDFVALEEAKIRAAEAKRVKELQEAERKREEAIAEAKSLEEKEAIQEDFCNAQEEITQAAPPPPARATGQIVRHELKPDVVDPWLLARNHPELVTITPRMRDIKDRINNGEKIAGVVSKRVVVSTVRASKPREAIDV